MAKSKTQHDEEQMTDLESQAEGHEDAAELDDVADSIDGAEVTDDVESVIRALEQERDDAVEARLRALADFKNFQRRSEENELRALSNGTTRVVRELISVMDQFDLALQSDPSSVTPEQIIEGVRLVRDEMTKALSKFKLEVINPAEGDEFDPNLHEAMVRQPSDAVPPNAVLSTYQPGYQIGDTVLRAAQVIVAAAVEPSGDEEG